ncbi:MAG: hypothetical protein ACK2UH_12700, partial [Candidatus Promineifilaceae bacterium]
FVPWQYAQAITAIWDNSTTPLIRQSGQRLFIRSISSSIESNSRTPFLDLLSDNMDPVYGLPGSELRAVAD